MLVLKHMQYNSKREHLQMTFSKLTENNQQYVLGLVEGLRQAQGKELREKRADGPVKMGNMFIEYRKNGVVVDQK